MGQDSTWHLQQLNQYISVFNSSIHSDSNNSNGIQDLNNNTSSSSSLSTVLSSASVASSSTSKAVDTFELFTHRQLHNFSQALAERLSAAFEFDTAAQIATTKPTTISSDLINSNGNNDDNIIIWNISIVLLIILYCIVVFGGIFGNASLVITLYAQSSARLRNPLLVALCLADLMVTGVAAPLTMVTFVIMVKRTWTLSSVLACKTIHFMQSMPVAASTISLLMLSLDRYATVKHPRLAQLRQRRYLPDFLAFGSWISAIIVSIPILLAYNISSTHDQSSLLLANITNLSLITTSTTEIYTNPILTHNFSESIDNVASVSCQPDFGTAHMQNIYLTIYTLFVFILPGIGVVLNHLGVRQKLCALSLTARAAHGELPLPMPILRRPTHMIIVTGMANAAAVRDDDDSTNDDDNQQKDERRYMMDSTKLKATPRTPRSLRYGHSIRTHSNNPKNVPPSELPLPQTSTLRSRRRLANMLVAGSLVFVFCWSPHVICLICSKLTANDVCTKTVTDYSLLLGYTHSAVNPILHWALNHNSLRQSSFLLRLTTVQRFLRTHLRDRHHQPPPSSTNEAALGPFNPRYIKARPQQQYHAPPASSHFLY